MLESKEQAKDRPLVLIVEDEPKMAQVIEEYMHNMGPYRTHHFTVGEGVVEWVRQHQPDAVLLDVMLPGVDGMSICRAIREFSHVPIIMATARVEEIDRLLGLELGADDYLCKPFSPRELVARVKALLRRAGYHQETDDGIQLHIDHQRYSASLNGQTLTLTRVEFSLLQCLAQTPGRVYSRQQLMDRIYHDYRVVSDRTVDTHIKNLRRKLSLVLPGRDVVASVYGVGYKLCL